MLWFVPASRQRKRHRGSDKLLLDSIRQPQIPGFRIHILFVACIKALRIVIFPARRRRASERFSFRKPLPAAAGRASNNLPGAQHGDYPCADLLYLFAGFAPYMSLSALHVLVGQFCCL